MLNSRSEAIGGFEKIENPSSKFFKWNSNDKTFSFYNGSENELIKLPFRFCVLAELQTVKGWNDALSGTIISNEVQAIGTDELKAYCYAKDAKGEKKRTLIAQGVYKNIKDALVSAGAKYHKSIYIMLEDGSIANIQLKGAGVMAWGEFANRNKKRLLDEWVTVASVKEGKKGAVKYTTPEFKFDKSFSVDELAKVEDAFEVLKNYLNNYFKQKDPVNIEVIDPVEVDPTEDELAF